MEDVYEHEYRLAATPLERGRLYTSEELVSFGFFKGTYAEFSYLTRYPNEASDEPLYTINIAHPIYNLLPSTDTDISPKKEENLMYNRFTYTYEQAKPILAEVEKYLAAKAHKLPECDNPVFSHYNIYIAKLGTRFSKSVQAKQIAGLVHAGWLEEVPWDLGETAVFVHKQANATGNTLTLSKTHVRLPQLSYLITLTPADFFLFFRTIAGQRNLLSFELAETDIPERFQSWFSPYYKGQRINSKIADRRWVPRYTIDTIAQLIPAEINDAAEENAAQLAQLAAMQYITVMRDDSLITVPVTTVLTLELDWEQIKDNNQQDTDYCISMPDSTSYVLLGN